MAKATPLKTLRFPPFLNLMFFGDKFYKTGFQLFAKLFSQIFFDFDQKRMILHSFSRLKKKKKKKKNSQKEKFGSAIPIKQGFLFLWPNGMPMHVNIPAQELNREMSLEN